MTNTQSPAPGVAAEVERLLAELQVHYNNTDSFNGFRKPLTAALRTALQASAAAVPVAWINERGSVFPFDWPDGDRNGWMPLYTHPKQPDAAIEPVAEVIGCKSMGGPTVRELEGRWKFLRVGTKLYTAPPLPAQVQEAAGSAFDDGWRLCAKWAHRDDLLPDMDSKPYLEAKAICLAAITASGRDAS